MNEDTTTVINGVLCIVLFGILVTIGLDMKVPYPKKMLELFDQPLVRLLTYVALYHLAYYNPVVSLLCFMCVIFLHIDYVNLVTKNPP